VRRVRWAILFMPVLMFVDKKGKASKGILLIRSKVKRHLSLFCHSGLSGIFRCFQKDSRRASLAGMTTCEALLMTSLVIMLKYRCPSIEQTASGGMSYRGGKESLRSHFATLKNGRGKHRKYLSYAFTGQGLEMRVTAKDFKSAIMLYTLSVLH